MKVKKLALFGPREKQIEEDHAKLIARAIAKSGLRSIATGGVIGFPTQIIRGLKQIGLELGLTERLTKECYTPCRNILEWKTYQESGFVPEIELFDSVYWSENQTNNIKLRALKRIPELIEDSDLCLAYLAGQGNTNIEVLSALSLGIPTLGLLADRSSLSIESSYMTLSRGSDQLRLYSDINKFLEEINRRLK